MFSPDHDHSEWGAVPLPDPDTSVADYVWLPIRFDGDQVLIDWHDEWRIEDYD